MNFINDLIGEDDEPCMDTRDVIMTLRCSNIEVDETTRETLYRTFKHDPYVFFKTAVFAADRERERTEQSAQSGATQLSQLPDSAYTCSQCKSRKVLTSQEQIRSGDEGATTFYDCQNCGHRWK